MFFITPPKYDGPYGATAGRHRSGAKWLKAEISKDFQRFSIKHQSLKVQPAGGTAAAGGHRFGSAGVFKRALIAAVYIRGDGRGWGNQQEATGRNRSGSI
ncbi:MAG: hypothetical protein QNI88_10790 [Desulfobacterales bacterium]|nr:hypothetical protein [Desulfobacterales bacterium]